MIRYLAASAGIDINKDVHIRSKNFYKRITQSGTVGLGESYMLGEWRELKPLDELTYLACRAKLKEKFYSSSLILKVSIFWAWLCSFLFPNNKDRSKLVAVHHYDIGNELYEHMLDKNLQYSCAYFAHEDDDLDQAQINKMKKIADKLKLSPGQRVLDIGCGFGTLAKYLSDNYNVYVDGVTLSREQLDYASNLQAPKCSFYLCDYRDHVSEPYDRIVSVGMFEHVTPGHYREFMTNAHRLLKDDGIFLLHTIGSNTSIRIADPFMTKYIFPNSCLPSMAQISSSSEGFFIIEDVENLSTHYDKTLLCWKNNVTYNWDEINLAREKKGKKYLDQIWYRMWKFYLLICAGSFRARRMQVYQIVLAKEPNKRYER